MGFDDICNTGLGLGLGLGIGLGCLVKQEKFSQSNHHQKKNKFSLKHDQFLPSLTLGPSEDTYQSATTKIDDHDVSKVHGELSLDLQNQAAVAAASSVSAVSSFSNSSSVKKEKDFGGEEVELERVSSRVSTDEDEDGSPRKKLRLSKEQSAVLEDSFKEHSTLNPKQKQALAEQLNLRPRQVEVWFQNRRARTKLKQTEVDCELLKKCCETLTEENKRLHKELQELKSLKLTASYYMQLPAATLTMCPSCERVAAGSGGEAPPSSTSSSPFTVGQKSHFFNPFSTTTTTHPSAAC